jgi:hypothetical protein
MRFYSSLAFASAFLIACAGTPQDEAVPETAVPVPVPEQETAPAQPPIDNSTLPNILVTPAQNGKSISELQVVQNNPMAKAMMEAINEYLTRKKYNVTSLEGAAELDNVVQMQNDIVETDEDLSYLASLALGADVYIKFSGTVKSGTIAVDLNAYESSTARLLGSESTMDDDCGGNDQATISDCLHRAAKRAMPRLEKKIQAYWEKDREQGTQYKLIINIKGAFDEDEIEDLHDDIVSLLKKNFLRVNMNVMTSKTIDATVYAESGKFPDSQEIYSLIRDSLKDKTQAKKISITRKLILMDLE